jgi:hypothetical protein
MVQRSQLETYAEKNRPLNGVISIPLFKKSVRSRPPNNSATYLTVVRRAEKRSAVLIRVFPTTIFYFSKKSFC